MRLTIDTEQRTLVHQENGASRDLPLYSREAFELLSDAWLKVGWDQKHCYTFSWMGRPIIQHPDDLVRIQEIIHQVKPDVVVETGVAHGGSLVYYASLFEAMGHGRTIGIDIEIRPHNREAIESHPLFHRIDLVEGDSVSPSVVDQVHAMVKPDERVLVLLDSNHTKDHVLAELEAYHDLVAPGSYIVACDGVMELVHDTPRGEPGWLEDNPSTAAEDFARDHAEFELVQPEWPFNESGLQKNITHWPRAWLRKKE